MCGIIPEYYHHSSISFECVYILMLMEYPSLPTPDQNLGVVLGNDSRFVKRLVYIVAVWSAKESVAKLDSLSKNLECR